MKMISSEITQKTTIILFTKPIQKWKIITSKFLASFTIGIISIIPTLIFVYSLYHISNPKGNIDGGELIGSYMGVIMLLSVYSSIGLFCSSISSNIMVSFISTIIIIFISILVPSSNSKVKETLNQITTNTSLPLAPYSPLHEQHYIIGLKMYYIWYLMIKIYYYNKGIS